MNYQNPSIRDAQRKKEEDAKKYFMQKRSEQWDAHRQQAINRNENILRVIKNLKAERIPVTISAIATKGSYSRSVVRKGLLQIRKKNLISHDLVEEIYLNGVLASSAARDNAFRKRHENAVADRKQRILNLIDAAKSKCQRLPFTTELADKIQCHRETISKTLATLLEDGSLTESDLREIKSALQHGVASASRTGLRRTPEDRGQLILDQVLEAQQQGVAPTVAELAAWTNYSKQTVYDTLDELEARGQIMVAGKSLSPRPSFVLALLTL